MEKHREGDGSRPRSSGWPRVKKDTAGPDGTPPQDVSRTPRERRASNERRRETPSQTPEKIRRKGRKNHPERRRRTRQPATAQEGRGWTRYVP
ncbi:hypothetical protein NDU88_002649 [Pleurodeles waltl]|uniref:Uncharacterized protein n=1 Tax=Pleurodeles waltl TaxID=8319 RepID=A0AAV7TLQ2_PLEWA|nr:hypothetical protein NDU88_002649 [Pleurodeles waltl]